MPNIAKKLLKKITLYYVAAIAWFLISTWLLTIPGNKLPQENWLDKIGFDKVVHITMFALMTGLWCMALGGNRSAATEKKKLFATVAIVWFLYGIAMEFIQRYCIPNRSFDVWDIVADGGGCVIGFYLSRRYIKK